MCCILMTVKQFNVGSCYWACCVASCFKIYKDRCLIDSKQIVNLFAMLLKFIVVLLLIVLCGGILLRMDLKYALA